MNEAGLRRWTEAYFHWLEPQVIPAGHQSRTYTDVLATMFAKEFFWPIDFDYNRAVDGLDLRVEFFHEARTPRSLKPEDLGPCNMLEVLIGLGRRMAFGESGNPEEWTWHLFCNLEMNKFPDPMSPRQVRKVDRKLDELIWRQYGVDGSGGFFPLQEPDEDQTQLQLWDQMSAYINEIHPEY